MFGKKKSTRSIGQILWSKRLEFLVFVCGAVVMVLELIGSRILAPFLGNSIFVWTSLIGIILGALSLGYHLGGRFSQERPSFQILSGILLVAGLLIILTALLKDFLLTAVVPLGIRSGSVLATLALFAPTSVIMGMVSPYAVRLKISDVQHSGEVAGNLYAISTLGSIVGTFLAGFWLIPLFGSTQLLYALSLCLVLTSLLGGNFSAKIVSSVVIAFFWTQSVNAPTPFVYETDSAYNHIRVVDLIEPATQRPLRSLVLATENHSVIYRDIPTDLFASYHYLYRLDTLFTSQIRSGLTLGGGAYVSVQDFLRRFPEAQMTAVEIDPQVTEVATRFFGLPSSERLTIEHADARIFLNAATQRYDVIYGDAFSSYYSVPFQLTTLEAVKKVHDALDEDGIFVLNLISSLEGPGGLFLQSEYATLQKVFQQVYIFPSHFTDPAQSTLPQNIVLIATKNPERFTKDQLLQRANAGQQQYVEHLWERPLRAEPRATVLTDEHAPVDYFISKIL